MESGSFPSEWKKRNVVLIHKKDNKQCLKDYRPISLLPICGKILEKLIFNEMFKCFIDLINRDLNLVTPAKINF